MEYKLDKALSKATTLNETAANYNFWKTKPVEERLAAAIYLIKTAYRISEFLPMEKTLCSTRKLQD